MMIVPNIPQIPGVVRARIASGGGEAAHPAAWDVEFGMRGTDEQLYDFMGLPSGKLT